MSSGPKFKKGDVVEYRPNRSYSARHHEKVGIGIVTTDLPYPPIVGMQPSAHISRSCIDWIVAPHEGIWSFNLCDLVKITRLEVDNE